jgi:DMSO/TMAO reductase YedYZ heme-binding membrane subunit
MSTREARLERARQRAEEHQQKRKIRFRLMMTALFLYVVVPLIWNGAIEFGFARPIQTPEFKYYLNLVSLLAILTILFLAPDFLPKSLRPKKEKPKVEPSTKEVTV